MKTKTSVAQMDEIVFENRNKSYGAYFLRKSYNRHLGRALLISSAILIAGLAYPLVSSYTDGAKVRRVIVDISSVLLAPPKSNEKMDLPKPPPSAVTEVQRPPAFVTPKVVDGEDFDNPDPLNMDEFIKSSVNIPVEINPIKPVEKPDEFIEVPEVEKTFVSVEEMPLFPGGETERLKFLAVNTVYPTMAAETGIQGTVYVLFIVDTKGNITDVELVRGIGGGCDEEALRVVKMMPMWSPGKQNGRTVRVLFNMAIHFKLKDL